MKRSIRLGVVAALLFVVAACASTSQVSEQGVDFRPGQTRIALMPLDINLYLLTAGGVLEPRADWTEAAEGHVRDAIENVKASRKLELVAFNVESLPSGQQQTMTQVVKLHSLVGNEILVQRRIPELRPPTKEGPFDWSIGPHANAVGQLTGARYGLFVTMRDSYSSAGRVALNLLTSVLFGISANGGQQLGYASLVDLETGQIVWFGTLLRGTGDLRSPEAAQAAVDQLFAGLPES
ncbi:hypothetical protein [Minwuia thermotolerans]|uniref:hypothetical protein n=1 Tax=Minwuia thermotolerans TaxID=2056226 RepID=UPI000F635415|nr:hypothetical protein [Minwuia thermotolerans]